MEINKQKDIEYVVFQVSDLVCGLRLSNVREILPMVSLYQTPHRPEILLGFLNLDGSAIPVVSLAQLFQKPPKENELYAHLILMKNAHKSLSFYVDQVLEVCGFEEDSLLSAPQKRSLNDCVEAQIIDKGRTIHILSPDQLLLKEEQESLSSLQKIEQQRIDGLKGKPT